MKKKNILNTKVVTKSILGAMTFVINGVSVNVYADLNDGLVAYYPFNGNANDESGNGNDGTVNGATLTADRFGKANSAYNFDGVSNYINAVVGSEFSVSNLTISAWVNVKGPGNWNPRIVAVGPTGTSFQYYLLNLGGTSNHRQMIFGCCGSDIRSDSYIDDNKSWHHAVATTDINRNTYLYIDGQLNVTKQFDKSLSSFSSALLQIGYSDNKLDMFNGDIDDIRIYNRALSDSEIQQLYSEGEASTTDLTVTNITLTPTVPTLNTAFTAQVTVKNQGNTTSDAGKLTIWTNKAATPACKTPGTKTVTLGALNPGASTTWTFIGLKVAPIGLKTFRAFVDSSCTIVETEETNNQLTLNYRVRPDKLPDFKISSITLDPSAPTADGTFTATVAVTNQGNKAGDAGYLDLWADAPNAQTCGVEGDGWADVGMLAPGATSTFQIALPSEAAGTKTLRAFVDSWCETYESDENNNQFTQAYTVN